MTGFVSVGFWMWFASICVCGMVTGKILEWVQAVRGRNNNALVVNVFQSRRDCDGFILVLMRTQRFHQIHLMWLVWIWIGPSP